MAVACALCDSDGGLLVFRHAQFRVVQVDEAAFPAFYRVIWNAHVSEWSALPPADRTLCMEAVVAVEEVLREQLQPTKINLATLGNVVPHLHWHVVARFAWDSHYPAPIWAPAQRPVDAERLAHLVAAQTGLNRLIAQRLQSLGMLCITPRGVW